MKARIPGKRGLSKGAKMAVEDYIDTYEKAVTRRLLKLCCVALNKDFGFGKDRLARFVGSVSDNTDPKDEVYWWHVDKLLIDQIGIEFERESNG